MPADPLSVEENADQLWQAAERLRGSIDAADYKHVVLGLLFLKYVSDAFALRREKLKQELEDDGIPADRQEALLESKDEYAAEKVFWVPEEARWERLQTLAATDPDLASRIDEAVEAVERENPKLKNKLPRGYASRGISATKLGQLVTDVIAEVRFEGETVAARDMLGRVYEYFLGKFAAAEGKLGGEFFTPAADRTVARRDARARRGPRLRPRVRVRRHVRAVPNVSSRRTRAQSVGDISIFGQESNRTTWRLAHMNLAIHGSRRNLGRSARDTLRCATCTPTCKADFVLANPPFNIGHGRASGCADRALASTACRPRATRTTHGSSTS